MHPDQLRSLTDKELLDETDKLVRQLREFERMRLKWRAEAKRRGIDPDIWPSPFGEEENDKSSFRDMNDEGEDILPIEDPGS